MPDDLSEGELNTCVYPDHDKHCPMFEVGRMVKEAGYEYSDMSTDVGCFFFFLVCLFLSLLLLYTYTTNRRERERWWGWAGWLKMAVAASRT